MNVAPAGRAPPLRLRVLAAVNFVILCAAIGFYRHYGRRALWVAALADLLATAVVVLIGRLGGP